MIFSRHHVVFCILAVSWTLGVLAAPAISVVDHSTGRNGFADDPTALCNSILPGAGSAVTYPLPGSCTRYLRCGILGDPVVHACPVGLKYNRMSGRCDFPANVSCEEKRGLHPYNHRQYNDDTGFIVDDDKETLSTKSRSDDRQNAIQQVKTNKEDLVF